jgi:hypothetical protein
MGNTSVPQKRVRKKVYRPSPEDRDLVFKMASEGATLQDIAKVIGRSTRMICIKYGANLKAGREKAIELGIMPGINGFVGTVRVEITDVQRAQIRELTGFGLRDDQVATIVKIPLSTMTAHCREDLDIGRATAHEKVTKTLFEMAVDKEHVNATMFYLKTQCGWRETSNIEFPDRNGNPQSLTSNVNINISADKMQTLVALLNDTV